MWAVGVFFCCLLINWWLAVTSNVDPFESSLSLMSRNLCYWPVTLLLLGFRCALLHLRVVPLALRVVGCIEQLALDP